MSFQILQSQFRLWLAGEVGCVAYVDTGSAWVVAGPPIAPEPQLRRVTSEFGRAALECGRRVVYFGVEERLSKDPELGSIVVGHQTVLDSTRWQDTLRKNANLRQQLSRARNKGLQIEHVDWAKLAAGSPIRRGVEQLIAQWQHTRPMPEMGFLAQMQPLLLDSERRFYIASHANECVGFAALDPVYLRGGWALQHLVRAPNAPNGTSEALIDAAVRHAAASNMSYFNLGLTPLAGNVGPWLGAAKRLCAPLYNFAGLERFRAKFQSRGQVPIYIAYPRGSSPLVAVLDCLVAFARGRPLHFGARVLAHRLTTCSGSIAEIPSRIAERVCRTRKVLP